jgi:hypothetical protein
VESQGAILSDVTAQKEYGIDRNFIVKGIRAGKLEFREGSVWGNPYIRVLMRQLEQYIADELGAEQESIYRAARTRLNFGRSRGKYQP